MARSNKTQFALLGMLMNEPKSGYDLKKFSDKSISHFWSENYGHIYPILKRMKTTGLVKKQVIQRGGKPARHVYHITERGRSIFLEWLKVPPEREIRRNEFLLKLFFGGFLPSQALVELIEFERSRNAMILEKYNFLEEKSISKLTQGGAKKFASLTLSYGRKLGQARALWCEEVLRELKKKKR
jgi:PadR family transcriptional regulator AphA